MKSPSTPIKPLFTLACTVLVAVASVKSAGAVDYTWDGAIGLFSLNTNWSSDIVPVAGDRATIANGGTAQIETGDNFTVSFLDLNNGNISQTGGTLLSTNRVKIGNLTGTATFTQTSGTLTSNERIYFADGNGAGSVISNMTGTIGGTVSANDYLVVGRQGGNANITVASGGVLNKLTTTNHFIVADGNHGVGTLTIQTGGSASSANETWIGNGGNAVGVMNINGGTYTGASWIAVGRGGSDGTLNITAGSMTKNGTGAVSGSGLTGNNFVAIGSAANSRTATINQSGGTFTNADSVTVIGEGSGNLAAWNASGGTSTHKDLRVGFSGTGTMTVSGSAAVTATVSTYLGSNASGTGTLNLNGGTFTTNFIEEGAGNGFVNFNEGVLRASAASGDFLADFEDSDLNVQAGGLIFDTNNNAVTITQALAGVGGLTKQGAGTLTLSSINVAYQGDTIVEGGTLTINTAFLADTSNVYLETDGVFNLNFAGLDDINFLFFNDVQQAAGTWGAIGSGADHESMFFTGNGLLVVVPEPSTYGLALGGFLGLLVLARRRAIRNAHLAKAHGI